ncbi:PREDICTED: platelet binding protein GspB-like [Priapulus caudatus]|uniref:Platelet binding protein GspB-like n=1 Tax=Priapulus caudatus TaxID=37621 RepID=A0ABM1F8Y2_PRICU|nr:PREDICTED: platelet binding protein GspB-like [Priapulus caudatus]
MPPKRKASLTRRDIKHRQDTARKKVARCQETPDVADGALLFSIAPIWLPWKRSVYSTVIVRYCEAHIVQEKNNLKPMGNLIGKCCGKNHDDKENRSEIYLPTLRQWENRNVRSVPVRLTNARCTSNCSSVHERRALLATRSRSATLQDRRERAARIPQRAAHAARLRALVAAEEKRRMDAAALLYARVMSAADVHSRIMQKRAETAARAPQRAAQAVKKSAIVAAAEERGKAARERVEAADERRRAIAGERRARYLMLESRRREAVQRRAEVVAAADAATAADNDAVAASDAATVATVAVDTSADASDNTDVTIAVAAADAATVAATVTATDSATGAATVTATDRCSRLPDAHSRICRSAPRRRPEFPRGRQALKDISAIVQPRERERRDALGERWSPQDYGDSL